MGLYNVVEPCEVVSKDVAVQFVRPTPEFQPVEVDDDAAAELVAAGKLTAYEPGGVKGATGTPADGVDTADDPPVEVESPASRRRRRTDDEG